MCIRDRPEPWIPLPANGSQNHHHIPPAAGERETCTHATASTTGGPHVPRSAGPFPSPKCFLCPLCPITEPAGGPYYGAFYRSEMYPLLARLNAYLVRWIRKKYKRLKAKKKAFRCWRGIVKRCPRMFAHWEWVPSVPSVW